MSDLLLIERDGRVAVLTVNRPQQLNALNKEVFDALDDWFRAATDDPTVGGVILTGAGEKAFVAGADIKEFADFTPEQALALSRRGQEVFLRIERFPKPVIAAVNGFALGGGCELALACHVRVASTKAKFGTPEVSLGVIPGYGATQRLPRLIGKGRALELLLTGKMVDGAEAYRIGLANAVAEPADLMSAARAMLDAMLDKGPLALQAAIAVVNTGLDLPLEEAMEAEARAFGRLFDTADLREGTRAFMEKRKAEFKGK
jgi:enoyl-CoA hydratase